VVAEEVILLGGRGQAGGGGAGSGMDEGFSQEPPSSGMRSAPRARPAAAQPAASMNEGITDDDVPF
jgi:single-stranded DNA-binding protein